MGKKAGLDRKVIRGIRKGGGGNRMSKIKRIAGCKPQLCRPEKLDIVLKILNIGKSIMI